MRITIKHKGVASEDRWDRMIEDGLFSLADRVRVEEARVVIERRWDGQVPYRASTHIVTPGPDITADGVDHTIQAAVMKMLRALDTGVRQRHMRRSERIKSKVPARALGCQGARR
jgi:ribosome-associated translation inhibitor RaiA